MTLAAIRSSLVRACIAGAALALLAACGGSPSIPSLAMTSTNVKGTWKDPRYLGAPMQRVFVVSLMKVDPGGRAAVEDAVVARLASAGVTGVASHTVMSDDAEKPGPSLEEAIAASKADGVLLLTVKAVGVYESYAVGQAITSISPDTMASYNFLNQQNVYEPGTYKIAHIVSELYIPSMGRQIWTAYTDSYDAVNLSRNLPDFTLKLVGVMAKDRMIATTAKPS